MHLNVHNKSDYFIRFLEKIYNYQNFAKNKIAVDKKKLKKPVNRFNFVMLNIPSSWCIIHINYSLIFYFYTIWRKQNRQKV
jgi:hypothetical protein